MAAMSACQTTTTTNSKITRAERHALEALLSGSSKPKDPEVNLAITGDKEALHRVLAQSTKLALDEDATEAQCYHLLRLLFSLGDHTFATALQAESAPVRGRVLLLLHDTFRQLEFHGSYPETEALEERELR